MNGLVITGLALFALAVAAGIIFGLRIWRLLSVKFVADQLDRAEDKGARTELRKMLLAMEKEEDKTDILAYLKDDPEKTQRMLQLVYAFNRIGALMIKGVLNRSAVFQTWRKDWFVTRWADLEPLIAAERKRRQDNELYKQFETFIHFCVRKELKQFRKQEEKEDD